MARPIKLKQPLKVNRHIRLTEAQSDYLSKTAESFNLTESDVIRMLIDSARVKTEKALNTIGN